eukprot:7218655-Pyramimonas_sp.AAC.1
MSSPSPPRRRPLCGRVVVMAAMRLPSPFRRRIVAVRHHRWTALYRLHDAGITCCARCLNVRNIEFVIG